MISNTQNIHDKILIRTDASVQIGTGHVMRCLTLADELCGRGADVVFVCREFGGNLCGYIEEKGYIVHRLSVSEMPNQNMESARSVLRNTKVVPYSATHVQKLLPEIQNLIALCKSCSLYYNNCLL